MSPGYVFKCLAQAGESWHASGLTRVQQTAHVARVAPIHTGSCPIRVAMTRTFAGARVGTRKTAAKMTLHDVARRGMTWHDVA